MSETLKTPKTALIVHADMSDEISARVGDGDVHRLTDFCGLLLRGTDDLLCIIERDHCESPPELENSRAINMPRIGIDALAAPAIDAITVR